jgi:hypothetical protein
VKFNKNPLALVLLVFGAYILISYFETKINYKLFDQIISAFKINGKQVEICRTTHNKSYNDLIRCTKLPLNAEICFLDDNFFPEMSHDNVYYINIKPYVHDLPFDEIINRFKNSQIGDKLIKDKGKFTPTIMNNFKLYNFDYSIKNEHEYDVDKILSKQILTHLHSFFNTSLLKNKNRTNRNRTNKNRTNRNKQNHKNKTMKAKYL